MIVMANTFVNFRQWIWQRGIFCLRHDASDCNAQYIWYFPSMNLKNVHFRRWENGTWVIVTQTTRPTEGHCQNCITKTFGVKTILHHWRSLSPFNWKILWNWNFPNSNNFQGVWHFLWRVRPASRPLHQAIPAQNASSLFSKLPSSYFNDWDGTGNDRMFFLVQWSYDENVDNE